QACLQRSRGRGSTAVDQHVASTAGEGHYVATKAAQHGEAATQAFRIGGSREAERRQRWQQRGKPQCCQTLDEVATVVTTGSHAGFYTSEIRPVLSAKLSALMLARSSSVRCRLASGVLVGSSMCWPPLIAP